MRRLTNNRGYTLIELMMVVVLIAIGGMIAIPSMKSSQENSQLAGAARAMIGILQFARSEAINNNSVVNVETQAVDDRNFTAEIRVCVAADENEACDNSDRILKVERLDNYGRAKLITSSLGDGGSAKSISFTAEGHLNEDSAVDIGICDGRGPDQSRQRYIKINPTGRSLLLDWDEDFKCEP